MDPHGDPTIILPQQDNTPSILTHQQLLFTEHEHQPLGFVVAGTDDATKQERRGAKKGGTRMDLPQSMWFELCERFVQGDFKSQVAFLRSDDSGPMVTEKHQMCFSRALTKYKKGALFNTATKRHRKRKWEQQEEKLMEYLKLRQKLKEFHDPTHVTWAEVRDIVASWDTSTDFVVTAGWVHHVMKKFNEATTLQQQHHGSELFMPKPTPFPTVDSNGGMIDSNGVLMMGPKVLSPSHALAVLQQVKVFCESRDMPAPIVGLADALMHQIEALPSNKKRVRASASGKKTRVRRKGVVGEDEDEQGDEEDDDDDMLIAVEHSTLTI